MEAPDADGVDSDGTDAGEFDPNSLNQSFYSADPADYYRTRLNLLVLAAARSDAVGDLMAEGVNYDGLLIEAVQGEATDDDDRLHQAYLVIESEQVLHHVSETPPASLCRPRGPPCLPLA